MTTIDNNDIRMQRFLEKNLTIYATTESKEERKIAEIIINGVYNEEKENALRGVKDPSKTMGFNYFVANYKDHETCLEYFATRMANEALTVRQDVTAKIHKEYPSYYSFINDKPNEYIIKSITEQDKDLGEFVESNLHVSKGIDEFIQTFSQQLGRDWLNYESRIKFFENLIKQLTEYYEKNCKSCSCEVNAVIAYLFRAYNLLADCKQISMTDEEIDKKTEGIYANKNNKWVMHIRTMSEMVKDARDHGVKVNNKIYAFRKD